MTPKTTQGGLALTPARAAAIVLDMPRGFQREQLKAGYHARVTVRPGTVGDYSDRQYDQANAWLVEQVAPLHLAVPAWQLDAERRQGFQAA